MKAILIETSETRAGSTTKIFRQYLLVPEAHNLLLSQDYNKAVITNLSAEETAQLLAHCDFQKEVEVSFDLVFTLKTLKIAEGFYDRVRSQANRLLLDENVELFFIIGANIFSPET